MGKSFILLLWRKDKIDFLVQMPLCSPLTCFDLDCPLPLVPCSDKAKPLPLSSVSLSSLGALALDSCSLQHLQSQKPSSPGLWGPSPAVPCSPQGGLLLSSCSTTSSPQTSGVKMKDMAAQGSSASC